MRGQCVAAVAGMAIILSLGNVLCSPLRAEEGDGGYAGAFLRMGIGARAQALGDAYTAVAEGAYCGFYNPAGVAMLPSLELMASVSLLTLDRKFYAVSLARPLRPKGVGAINGGLALGWVHAGAGDIDHRDLSGNYLGTFSNSENAFYLSFALYPHKLIALGVNGKILYNRFPGVAENDETLTASGFGIDFGVMIIPLRGLTLGLTVRDINSKYTWNTEKVWERGTSTVDRFPTVIRGGASYRLPGQWLMASADLEYGSKQDLRYHVGMEGGYRQTLVLRGGLDNGRVRLGLGVKLVGKSDRATRLDYAYVSTVDGLSADHIFAWVFPF